MCKIVIRRSKTIQYGQRKFESPITSCEGPLCEVSALKTFWGMYPAPPFAPVISSRDGKGVPYVSALYYLKAWCKEAGLARDIGLHSLKRGMATEMKNVGISLLDIQAAGDWQSLSLLRYLSSSLDRRLVIDQIVCGWLPT